MFEFFKKKKKVRERLIVSQEEILFLRAVVAALPVKYHFLLEQPNTDFICGKNKNPLGQEGSYTFLIDQFEGQKRMKRLARIISFTALVCIM